MQNKLRTKLSLLVLLLLFCNGESFQALSAEEIVSIASKHLPPSELIEALVGKGEFEGYVMQETFWEAKRQLQAKYSDFIGEDIFVGQSFENRQLKGFFVGRDVHNLKKQSEKAIVLLDSAHHAREAIGLQLILTVMLQELSSLVKGGDSSRVYDTVSIFFYPVVNPDGFAQIKKPGFREKRKNMRITGTCMQPQDEGVDINRNYDIVFDRFGEMTSNPCTDEFKGSGPFSEPETQAVRNIFDKFPSVRSALNFHSYGNIWIMPYNFNRPGDVGMDKLQPELFKLYEHFKMQKVLPPHASVGSAFDTIQYYTSGEASDWMSVVKGVFVWSPELGPDGTAVGDGFSTTPELQRAIVRDQLPAVTAFVQLHRPNISVTHVEWQEDAHEIVLNLENIGYGDIYNVSVQFQTEESESIKSIKLFMPGNQPTSQIHRMSQNASLLISCFPAAFPRLKTRQVSISIFSHTSLVSRLNLLGNSVGITPVSDVLATETGRHIERGLFAFVAVVVIFVFGMLITVKCLRGKGHAESSSQSDWEETNTNVTVTTNEMGYFKTNVDQI